MKKDVVRFEIWNLLWFHFSSITLFSLATGIKYRKYKGEAYMKTQKKTWGVSNLGFPGANKTTEVVSMNFMTSNRTLAK